MTILDVSIVNVALPSISRSLHFSRGNLQWVITAYSIAFGGFLLLAGRAADLLGRRRVFMVGVTLFTAASLVCGLASSEATLIIARAVQGLGGAITVSAGLALLVYTISRAPDVGWATARTILLLVASGALLVGFLVNERRVHDPLMPFHIFRVRTVAGANVTGGLLGAVIFANFFLLTLYVQNVLGYSALKTGVTFVATAGTAVVAAGVAQALTTRFGPRPIIAIGLALLTGAMIRYSQIPVHGSFVSNLLPGYVMVGVGIAFAFVPVSIAALAGVVEREAGLASGLINTSQQIGGALGTAVASTIFTSHFKSLRLDGKSLPVALTGGYSWAFYGLAVVGVLAFIAAITLIRGGEMSQAPATAPVE